MTNIAQNSNPWKSIDGVLGIRPQDRKMEGANESTEPWRPPLNIKIFWVVIREGVLRAHDLQSFKARQPS